MSDGHRASSHHIQLSEMNEPFETPFVGEPAHPAIEAVLSNEHLVHEIMLQCDLRSLQTLSMCCRSWNALKNTLSSESWAVIAAKELGPHFRAVQDARCHRLMAKVFDTRVKDAIMDALRGMKCVLDVPAAAIRLPRDRGNAVHDGGDSEARAPRRFVPIAEVESCTKRVLDQAYQALLSAAAAQSIDSRVDPGEAESDAEGQWGRTSPGLHATPSARESEEEVLWRVCMREVKRASPIVGEGINPQWGLRIIAQQEVQSERLRGWVGDWEARLRDTVESAYSYPYRLEARLLSTVDQITGWELHCRQTDASGRVLRHEVIPLNENPLRFPQSVWLHFEPPAWLMSATSHQRSRLSMRSRNDAIWQPRGDEASPGSTGDRPGGSGRGRRRRARRHRQDAPVAETRVTVVATCGRGRFPVLDCRDFAWPQDDAALMLLSHVTGLYPWLDDRPHGGPSGGPSHTEAAAVGSQDAEGGNSGINGTWQSLRDALGESLRAGGEPGQAGRAHARPAAAAHPPDPHTPRLMAYVHHELLLPSSPIPVSQSLREVPESSSHGPIQVHKYEDETMLVMVMDICTITGAWLGRLEAAMGLMREPRTGHGAQAPGAVGQGHAPPYSKIKLRSFKGMVLDASDVSASNTLGRRYGVNASSFWAAVAPVLVVPTARAHAEGGGGAPGVPARPLSAAALAEQYQWEALVDRVEIFEAIDRFVAEEAMADLSFYDCDGRLVCGRSGVELWVKSDGMLTIDFLCSLQSDWSAEGGRVRITMADPRMQTLGQPAGLGGPGPLRIDMKMDGEGFKQMQQERAKMLRERRRHVRGEAGPSHG